MPEEILSVAIFESLPGMEQASLDTMRALIGALERGGYCRDAFYRDSQGTHHILFRYWKSEATRRAALEDAEVLRCWAKLAGEIEIVRIYERLEEITFA
jgi:hypothetical protein